MPAPFHLNCVPGRAGRSGVRGYLGVRGRGVRLGGLGERGGRGMAAVWGRRKSMRRRGACVLVAEEVDK